MNALRFSRAFLRVLFVVFPVMALRLDAALELQNAAVYEDARTGVAIVTGEVENLDAWWCPVEPGAGTPLAHVYLLSENFSFDDEAFARKEMQWDRRRTRRFAAVVRDREVASASFSLRQLKPDGAVEEVRVDLAAARKSPASRAVFTEWAQLRSSAWAALAHPDSPNPLADFWKVTLAEIYGDKDSAKDEGNPRRARSRRDDSGSNAISTLSILGGQTAIRETLQTELLANAGSPPAPGDATAVDVSTLEGVSVKAHPYAGMLAALKLPPVPGPGLADYVPVDRLFVLLRDPGKLSVLLSGGGETAGRLAPFLGESFADHDIAARYTAKFGLTLEQARRWFSGGNVAEAALFAPDVFFRDNTDITLVLKLKPGASTPFKLAAALSGARVDVPLADGGRFHLAVRDNLFFLSSNKDEIERALALAAAGGKGSLGHSDEFRVMTARLPATTDDANSGAYVYFSDPFIRRLTGPAVKIGQLRRAVTRARMEAITLAALSHRLDHGVDVPDLAQLAARYGIKGILEKDRLPAGMTLSPGCVVASAEWGPLSMLRPLSANPVGKVSAAEAAVYKSYRDNYTRYWREFFDPIAVRLELAPNGKTSLETFILPLIDNSLYEELRDAFAGVSRSGRRADATSGDATAANPAVSVKSSLVGLPIYRDTPVATMAFQLPNSGRGKVITRMLDSQLMGSFGVIAPLLGDYIAIAVNDSAPVVQATFPGLNDISSARGRGFGVDGKELLLVPFVSALITRPCDIAIPLSDPAAARAALRHVAGSAERWVEFESVYVEKENRLLFTLNAGGVVRAEFAISVEGNWLHISNHPWTANPIIGTLLVTPSNAVLTLSPAGMRTALPQALAQAASAWRKSLYATAAEILPWMQAYGVDAAAAAKLQRAALGRSTPLPAGIAFDTTFAVPRLKPFRSWFDARIPNSNFDDTGFLRGLRATTLWMRFEDDGLRSRLEFEPEE
ncbi:MAG: hypothetical protein LBD14_06335 [Puniceicoccales bacterium]|nr:hypothetical protein [Puniceicoccales bacterium]